MDANNFKNSVRELITHVMMGNIATVDINKVNLVLQYAIQNNALDNKDLQALVIALAYFKQDLPYFTVLQLNLINELTLYAQVLTPVTVPCVTSTATEEKTACACPIPQQKENGYNTQHPDENSDITDDLTPEKIAETAGMFHREIQMDPSNKTKTIKTYEHMTDGTLQLVNTEILVEPSEADIFANILGEEFNDNSPSPQLSENDL